MILNFQMMFKLQIALKVMKNYPFKSSLGNHQGILIKKGKFSLAKGLLKDSKIYVNRGK